MEYIVVFVTCSSVQEADTIAQVLLEKRAIACANMINNISSRFWWKGVIDSAQETLLIAKTEKKYFDEIQKIIKKNHSYEVPEIIALPIVDGAGDYLSWISASVAPV